MNGLCGPNQLTSVKLEILIMTPINSSVWMCDKTKLFSLVEIKTPPYRRSPERESAEFRI
jgi:hypothetical protein